MKAILTFDLEYWHNSKFLKPKHDKLDNDFILETVLPIMELLKSSGHRATFFVLGSVAQKYPELIKQIYEQGHEIACHGYGHKIITELNEDAFEKELEICQALNESIVGKKLEGFRAPNFSIGKKTPWARRILKRGGFIYDSSDHPLSFVKEKSTELKIIEASLGGFYFRILPLTWYLFFIRHFSKFSVPVLYFHPHELSDEAPKITGSWLKRKIKYSGTKKAWKKFQKLMSRWQFISVFPC